MAKSGSTGARSATRRAKLGRVAVDGDGAVGERRREVEGAGDEPDEGGPGEGEGGDCPRLALGDGAWLSAPLRSSTTWVVPSSVMTHARTRCSSQALGPSMRTAMLSKTCSTLSASHDVGRRGRGGGAEAAVAQLGGAGEEGVAPGAVLGAEAELLERVGLSSARASASVSSANTTWLSDLGAPPVVAVVERLSGHGERPRRRRPWPRRTRRRPRPAGAATGGPGWRRTSPCSAGRWP